MHEKIDKKRSNGDYVTVVDDDGENYKEIAAIMTEMGYPMIYTSARNCVIKVIKKFAKAYAERFDSPADEDSIDSVARDPTFQHVVSEILHCIESNERQSSI